MQNIQFIPSAIDAGGCISNAWEMLKGKYGMYLGISLITMLLTGCIPCLNVFIMGPVMGGVFYVVLRDMRGDPVDFGMMFKGFEKFVPLMIIGLLQAIPGIIAQIMQYSIRFAELGLGGGARRGSSTFFQAADTDLAISSGLAVLFIVVTIVFTILGILWWAAFFFAVPLAMEYDMNAVDAIKLSARAAFSNLGGLIVLLIFEALVMIVGLLMLCLGVFFLSIPIMYLANAFAYRQVFPLIERHMNVTPPPPTAYGSSFGTGM